ncbi:hypothetical protein [uncultured Tenacibaculum sp.]|uniref:hypothetical protein n=1 Tax=uncultured Tenacibaculum sp. TaxID=174713 RepID=UPI0026204DB4|nr:hypothetical protein [uncultured Tenacibaculum sp.]
METILENNDTLFKVLNQLVLDKHYEGNISPEYFEFARTSKSNNIRIIGKLTSENNFILSHDYVFPTNYSFRIFLLILLFADVYFIYKNNWFPVILFLVLSVGLIMSFRVKGNKQKELFIDQFKKTKTRLFEGDN